MDNVFIEYSIKELIDKMKKKEMSSSDLVRTSLKKIQELNPKYLAWENYADDGLVEQVAIQEKRDRGNEGLLYGIPVGIKDIYNTADFPTQMGSPLWKGFTPGNDARAVFNLKRQGAVVIGKTVTAEFAVHALEKTLNPYDKTRTPGTSSSGSAVAVALGMVPVATGTQTAGSIVRPASFCGIYGMKPSFGFIPRTGTLKTTDSLDTLGFFAMHQEDLRRVFDAMRVAGKDYPLSNNAITDAARQEKDSHKPWRVGFARTHTWGATATYAKDALEAFMHKLAQQKGIEVIDAPLPTRMKETHSIHKTIYDKALSYYFKGEYKQSDFVSPIMNELIMSGNTISTQSYTDALAAQTVLIYEMDEYFKNFDVLISLSTAGEAPPREVTELPDPALMWTLAHLPVASVPAFHSPSRLPFGMQVIARKYNDYRLLNFLDYLELLGMIPKKASFSPKGE